jgi:dolichol kinase
MNMRRGDGGAMNALGAEAWRKAVHLSTIVLPVWIWMAPWPWTWRGPLLAFLAVLGLDLARFVIPSFGSWIEARVGGSLRPSEHRALISVHALTGAALLLALAAPPAIAATALSYLVVGDSAAALVGHRFGRHRFGSKSLEGSLACLAACLAVGIVTLPGQPIAILGGALAATLAEGLPWPVEDNWSVPLLGAAALVGLVHA